tara:strand:- start:737 stop:847 length:111 start_codon:yes stop_codon:yes gene_type:complete
MIVPMTSGQNTKFANDMIEIKKIIALGGIKGLEKSN